MTALAQKEKGNEAFKAGKWEEAVGYYSAAIFADATEPLYPLNRAMAWLKCARYIDAERDCNTALSLIDHDRPLKIKALYRRGTARAGSNQASAACQDFEAVLALDPNNTDAKRERDRVKTLLAQQVPLRKQPLDLSQQSSSTPLTRSDAPSRQSRSRPDSDDGGGGGGSSRSVEAARRFLEQVGMDDALPAHHEAPAREADYSSVPTKEKLKQSASAIPDRFPGETGGLLRELTTRKLPSDTTSASRASVSTKTSEHTNATSKSPSLPAAAAKTASALAFGASPAAIAQHTSIKQAATPLPPFLPDSRSIQLNAYDFDRRWRESGGGRRNFALVPRQILFLQSLDIKHLCKSLGPLFEPDLLWDIVWTLAETVRQRLGNDGISDARASKAKLPESEENSTLRRLVKELVTILPSGNRFSVATAFMDTQEKQDAALLLHLLEDSDDLTPDELASLHARWGV